MQNQNDEPSGWVKNSPGEVPTVKASPSVLLLQEHCDVFAKQHSPDALLDALSDIWWEYANEATSPEIKIARDLVKSLKGDS